MRKIFNIICSGQASSEKTDIILSHISEMKNYGYGVIVTPEATTLLADEGLRSEDTGMETFQAYVLLKRLELENQNINRARLLFQQYDKGVIILNDGSMLDSKTYLPDWSWDQYDEFLKWHTDLSLSQICKRYYAQFHFQTAATDGKDQFSNSYTNKESQKELQSKGSWPIEALEGCKRNIIIKGLKNSRIVSFDDKRNKFTAELVKILT